MLIERLYSSTPFVLYIRRVFRLDVYARYLFFKGLNNLILRKTLNINRVYLGQLVGVGIAIRFDSILIIIIYILKLNIIRYLFILLIYNITLLKNIK